MTNKDSFIHSFTHQQYSDVVLAYLCQKILLLFNKFRSLIKLASKEEVLEL